MAPSLDLFRYTVHEASCSLDVFRYTVRASWPRHPVPVGLVPVHGTCKLAQTVRRPQPVRPARPCRPNWPVLLGPPGGGRKPDPLSLWRKEHNSSRRRYTFMVQRAFSYLVPGCLGAPAAARARFVPADCLRHQSLIR
eukprot:gene3345-biopygen20208